MQWSRDSDVEGVSDLRRIRVRRAPRSRKAPLLFYFVVNKECPPPPPFCVQRPPPASQSFSPPHRLQAGGGMVGPKGFVYLKCFLCKVSFFPRGMFC